MTNRYCDNDNRKEIVVKRQAPKTYEEELLENFERLKKEANNGR